MIEVSLDAMSGKFLVQSIKQPNSGPREYRRRKHHTKDRLGCLTCKHRRIKCDKANPVCLRCIRAQRTCQYESATLQTSRVSTQLWSAMIAESVLGSQLQAAGTAHSRNATPISALLSHIACSLGDGVFLPMMPLDPSLWHLSCQHPHLPAAILSVSACHLSYHTPDASASRMAKYALVSTTLALFRAALLQQFNSQPESDALL